MGISYRIICGDPACGETTPFGNIPDLILEHRNYDGWFICSKCENWGYVKSAYTTQEGYEWLPILKGAIRLEDDPREWYQPFVFLVSYDKPENQVEAAWFRYYKDLRPEGGLLKAGAGPGGSPIVPINRLCYLVDAWGKTVGSLPKAWKPARK